MIFSYGFNRGLNGMTSPTGFALVGYSCGEGCANGDILEQVSGEMDAGALTSAPFGATLPHTALELPADRLG
jgi:hypothetical protein